MTPTSIKNYGLFFYDLAVGAFHLALIQYLTLLFFWPTYAYFQTGVSCLDFQTYVGGGAVFLISSAEFFKKFIAVLNRLIQAREHLAR